MPAWQKPARQSISSTARLACANSDPRSKERSGNWLPWLCLYRSKRVASLSIAMPKIPRTATGCAWQHAVYDTLFAAWSSWNQEWEAAQTRRALARALPSGEASGARNAQIVRDELKRQVISWLLDESSFQGRNALKPLPAGEDGKPLDTWREIDLAQARTDGPAIQFLEQAFEWANMTYVFYPYYWAGREHWDELANLAGVDPDFERFLKSGSARVVVPARPGMEAAVHHWLIYQEPFWGQPMPLPGQDMYVSVATEIRDLTRPLEGGTPGESWETRVGTTLLWLDDSGNLPKNTRAQLGAPPNQPKEFVCKD